MLDAVTLMRGSTGMRITVGMWAARDRDDTADDGVARRSTRHRWRPQALPLEPNRPDNAPWIAPQDVPALLQDQDPQEFWARQRERAERQAIQEDRQREMAEEQASYHSWRDAMLAQQELDEREFAQEVFRKRRIAHEALLKQVAAQEEARRKRLRLLPKVPLSDAEALWLDYVEARSRFLQGESNEL